MQWARQNIFALHAARERIFPRARFYFRKRDRPDIVIESSGRTRGNERPRCRGDTAPRRAEINSARVSRICNEYFLRISALQISNVQYKFLRFHNTRYFGCLPPDARNDRTGRERSYQRSVYRSM